MKKFELRQLIREEIQNVMKENQDDMPTHKSKVNWYYVDDLGGRVIPDAKGYDLKSYPSKELYIKKGTEGQVLYGNRFEDEEGNDVPFSEEYFEEIQNVMKEDTLNEATDPSRMLELIEMYVDNYFDEGMSAEAALKKITELFQGKLDGYDKAFMAGEEDQY